MKVLVYPHDLAIGGSQLNAIEIAAAVARSGHEVAVFGRPGALVGRIEELGLEFIESPDPRRRPSVSVVRALAELVETRGIDVVHGYEWPPSLEAHLAVRHRRDAVAVSTVMSMSVAPFIPRSQQLLVGTEQIAAAERGAGRDRVGVLEPPVDLTVNHPDHVEDVADFRMRYGLSADRPTIVVVTRLAYELKLEGLLSAMDAVGALSRDLPVQLVIVGGGDAASVVAERARRINEEFGADTVVLTGELSDPRPAYAAATVTLGMGGSALRALAFAKPLVVQGENGFWRLLTPETLPEFLWTGWYGYGSDPSAGAAVLQTILRDLLGDEGRQAELARFGLELVRSRFSIDAAARVQIALYDKALADAGSRSIRADVVAAAQFGRYFVGRRAARVLGRSKTDDFNSAPVARQQRRPASAIERVVYLPGVSWDAIAGTDRQLAEALAAQVEVLWVDPPLSWLRKDRSRPPGPARTVVAPGITRLRTIVPPLVSRPGIRTLAQALIRRRLRRELARHGDQSLLVLASSPDPVLASGLWADARTVYYATDDFVAGAGLMGMSTDYAARSERRNLRAADLVIAVSQPLVERLSGAHPAVSLLPNGCDPTRFDSMAEQTSAAEIRLAGPIAGVVGQLNDRIDLDVLEAVAATGVSLLLLGPRSGAFAPGQVRAEALLARANVQWIDRQPAERLPQFYRALSLGLTPYVDTAFNRASFPLKTLEYLAAGLPVVSSDLPATRWLDTDLVRIATGAEEFTKAVTARLDEPGGRELADRCRAFADTHSWPARAAALLKLAADPL